VGFRDGETVSQLTLDQFFYVRIVVPELMPCSTMVVQDAVNIEVVGSSPTGAVWNLGRVVYGSGLLNRRGLKSSGGSNPSDSVKDWS
jgi:hypothetical protein